MNYVKTAMLLAVLTAIFVALGGLVGGGTGMVIAFIVAMGMNFFSYWNSDKMVLRMYGAHEVDATSAPEYYGVVRDLAQRAGLPMPRVYVMDSPQPNAFATGRNPSHAAVCASTGLLQALNRDEIAGVMAHELAHIKNHDTLTMTIAAAIGGAISMLAQYMQFGMMFGGGGGQDNRGGGAMGMVGSLLAILVAPLAAMLVQMAISRSREYGADRMGAEICGRPLWLASALAKIQNYAHRFPTRRPRPLRPPRTCSSSIPCPARAWTTCSPRIPIPRTALPRSMRWRARWARPRVRRAAALAMCPVRIPVPGRSRRRVRATPAARGAHSRW